MTCKINADTTNGLKLTSDTSGEIDLQIDASTKVHMASDGKLGIGTTSPSSKLTVQDFGNDAALYVGGGLKMDDGPGNPWYLGKGILGSTGSEFLIGNGSNELLRIDQSGNVYFGTTGSAPWTATSGTFARIGNTFPITATAQDSICAIFNRNTGDGAAVECKKSGTVVGSISVTASATAYNTSSDYRLKENVEYSFDATTRLKQLKPCRFNFKADTDKTVDGFIAHEVQAIVPEAVTGEKDAVDEEGNPIYQGIDQSKIVPLLVGAIKELSAKVAALESQLNA